MRYTRFEALTIGVGGVAILATVGFYLQPQLDWVELVGQFALLGVLVSAVHWGRKGGLVGALVATVLYVALRLPDITATGLGTDILELIVIRASAYGLIGVIGGEICGRIKYFFARVEDSLSIDESARVYNQRFVAQLLSNSLATANRYGTLFSIVVVELSPALTSGLRASKTVSLVRAVADYIRNDVRLIDDVGRLDDGRFVIVLPHTPKAGANVAGDRVCAGLRDTLGAKDESVSVRALCSSEDAEAIQALTDSLLPKAPAADSPLADPLTAPISL